MAQSETNLALIDSIHKNVLLKKSQDSTTVANAYYALGELYRFSFSADSAYYYYHKAQKYYERKNDNYKLARTLYGIAVVQKNEKDLTGSELTSVRAMSLLEPLKETESVIETKAFIYNNLGIVFGELEQYEESISYYERALTIKEKMKGDNKLSIDISKNNLALSYKKSGAYDLALEYYGQILNNQDLIDTRPDFYALVLDNYAHTKFLNQDFGELPNLFFKALKVSDSINPGGYNSISINQHLAEYYKYKNDITAAKHYAYQAKDIAENFHKDELLSSLLLLSKIDEGEKAADHLKAYIKLNDSLQKNERAIRNKFARIRFETSQIEKENIQIAKERMWLLIISVVIIIASILLYLVIAQRNKNKELQFIQQQQETNEEIYNLMLSQNESIEEARALEKKRISEELHDGVLGRLFGTRLSLDSLNMNNSTEAVKTRGQYIAELKTIEEDIRKVSHELNTDFVSGSGFIDIIKTLVETQTLAYNLTYKLEHDDDINWDAVTNKKKIHIYRIIQETLHNIYKHAQANHVIISFKLKNNVICLSITDDGSGFDVNKAKSGIGLKNINSRINEISGTLKITSEKEVGTTVIIEAPIP
ncbi:tetratricopeptide repeat-containing sensor histidine kinase [Tamlana flava]|uniref:tetratricopeptide repeat-containing sensor histidine kinase n=1 Tax=Tamlana flava TaxID=3158572 RepID=UPI00351B5438